MNTLSWCSFIIWKKSWGILPSYQTGDTPLTPAQLKVGDYGGGIVELAPIVFIMLTSFQRKFYHQNIELCSFWFVK
jgi:hypothetical protein